MANVSRMHRPPGVGDVGGLVALDATTVPQIGRPLGQRFAVAGHSYPVCRLSRSTPVGFQSPAKPRLTLVQPGRSNQIFATESPDANRSRRVGQTHAPAR